MKKDYFNHLSNTDLLEEFIRFFYSNYSTKELEEEYGKDSFILKLLEHSAKKLGYKDIV